MVRKRNNQLPNNLPQLQNLIKRDPLSYKEEFLQQQRHYKALLNVFTLKPSEYNKNLDELVMFMAQVAHCYADILSTFAQEIMNVLQSYNTVLEQEMRLTFCRALILLRNKNLLESTHLHSLFFELLRSKDKQLRKFLQEYIITDIKNQNSRHKDAKLNRSLQNFMYTMLNDNNEKAAKVSLGIMIELYRKNVWNDAKTVNVISTACFSKTTKVMVAALKFFITSTTNDDDSESDSSDNDTPTARDIVMANKVNKKTRKRDKELKKVKKTIAKHKKKKNNCEYNFNAIHLIHDPQELAEKLLKQLEKRNERFEVKLLMLDVISRLIGAHQLILLHFYPYIQRFLQPHQREVTKLLQFAAQACHELVPPETVEPVLRALANNFITERNSSDVMAIGLNAVREMCLRAPLIMTEDLLKDLSSYKRYKERSVMMAARSLIHVYRSSFPELLHKKDRGRPTEATIEIKSRQYGEVDAKEYVPGAEILLEGKHASEDEQSNISEDDDEDEWVDVSHSSEEDVEDDEDNDENEEEIASNADVENIESDTVKSSNASEDHNSGIPEERQPTNRVISKGELADQRKKLAAAISTTRLLTDEDFKRIEIAQLKKQVTSAKNKKRSAESDINSRSELVNLGDIENIYKKRKHDKESRLDSIRKGREDREKFGYKDGRKNPFSSKTNRERNKKKNFQMIKQKAKRKVKRSFRDKQIALRNHLVRLHKMK